MFVVVLCHNSPLLIYNRHIDHLHAVLHSHRKREREREWERLRESVRDTQSYRDIYSRRTHKIDIES